MMSELNDEDQQWAQRAGEQLRSHEHAIAQGTQARLRSARGQALQAASEPVRSWMFWPAWGSGGLSAAVFAWVVFVAAPVEVLPVMDDIEMAAAQEAELLEELEFVAWMLTEREMDDEPYQG